MNNNLPEKYIRGILNSSYICSGYLTQQIFLFLPSDHNTGYDESSINWCDDEKTIEFSMQQKKETGEPLFGHGVAVLDTSALKTCLKQYGNEINCERYPVEGNAYHGNLLISKSITKQIKNIILAQLLLGGEIIERN